jgi:hypothetical protein
MPRGEERTEAKGQAYGAASQQQGLIRSTGGRAPAPEPDYETLGTDEPDESFEIPGFGSVTDAMLAPTSRPEEPLNTPYRPEPQYDLAAAPSLDMLRLVRDPNISSEFRETLKAAMISRALGPGALELDED